MLNSRKIELFDKMIEHIGAWSDNSIREFLGMCLEATENEIDEILNGEYDCKR